MTTTTTESNNKELIDLLEAQTLTTTKAEQRQQQILELFSSSNLANYHSEVVTETLVEATKNDKLKIDLLEACEIKSAILTDDALAGFKLEIKRMQRLFNKKGVQDRVLGKERETRLYFGKVKSTMVDNGQAKESQLGTYQFLEVPMPQAKEKEVKDLAEIVGDYIEDNNGNKGLLAEIEACALMLRELVAQAKAPKAKAPKAKAPKAKALKKVA